MADDQLGVYIVADGMGGHCHGEVAAELALSTIKYFLESSHGRLEVSWPFGYDFQLSTDSNRLATSIRLANRQVWKRAEEKPEYVGMGTTIAAVLVHNNQAAVANVGDSRVYCFRDGKLKQLSTDDTWINAVLQRGDDAQNLKDHPMRNVLMQAAGSQNDVSVHGLDIELSNGDLLLISSDGLHGVLPSEQLAGMLALNEPIQEIGNKLIQAAKEVGAPDNVTSVLIRYAAA